MNALFQPLAEKYRPRRIDQFIGLRETKSVLSEFAAQPYPSAWLFVGPSGTGKTSMALALAEAIPAQLRHIAAKSCTVEVIEEVCRKCHQVPGRPGDPQAMPFHLILVDESNEMSYHAQLRWLSKLDSTGALPTTIVIFTCNTTEGLQEPFISRCRSLAFTRDGMADELPAMLQSIWTSETGNRAGAPDFAKVVNDAGVNIRSALNLLEIEIIASSRHEPRDAPRPTQKLTARARPKANNINEKQVPEFTGEIHELCEAVPEMSPEAYAALKVDIQKRGVKVPVWLYQGKILDGRNRWRACQELGIPCPTIECDGPDPLSDIASLNVVRRHLDESQRAMVAATIANMKHGGDRKSKAEAQDPNLGVDRLSVPEAAKRLNVSHGSVEAAKKVRKEGGPALVAAVVSGKMSVSRAAKAVRKSEQGPKSPEPAMKSPLPKPDELKQDALWLWGEITLFHKNGVMSHTPTDLLSQMTEKQRADVLRRVPTVVVWLQGFAAERNK